MAATMEAREVARELQFPEGPVARPDGTALVVEIRRGTLSHVGAGGSEFQDHRVADPLLAPVTKTPFQRTACSSFLDPGSIETSRPISMTAVGGVGPAFFASLRARTSPPRMSAVTVMWDERTDQTIEVTLNVAADRNRQRRMRRTIIASRMPRR